ncbi:hypothetical protein HMPREF0576_1373 [Mobiluncus holmesii ATCC 35242]|uniref:Uncharacterized protein n=1 Tax=Mobiluncus holmesii ATCC 35242 TaxID=887899 RepID=E6M4Y3_9ACTO|nr:hypothetical protein HMPREF0576_1373 [Mobiluncus holmesii ATCC 35242]
MPIRTSEVFCPVSWAKVSGFPAARGFSQASPPARLTPRTGER